MINVATIKKLTLRLPLALHKELGAVAQQQHRSLNNMIIVAIVYYLTSQDNQENKEK